MKSQSIFRIAPRKYPFFMVSRKLAQDDRLSWKAKGVLLYLLSLPDDWEIHEVELAKHSPDGLWSLRSALKELLIYGYVVRRQVRREHGHFCGYSYLVYEDPLKAGVVVPATDWEKIEKVKTAFKDSEMAMLERDMREDGRYDA